MVKQDIPNIKDIYEKLENLQIYTVVYLSIHILFQEVILVIRLSQLIGQF